MSSKLILLKYNIIKLPNMGYYDIYNIEVITLCLFHDKQIHKKVNFFFN